jgi:fructokinase
MNQSIVSGKVMCFGEALIDMLSNKIDKDSNDENETFTKFAGGAPANVSVALAKLGGNSYFCGMLGSDPFGSFLYESLQHQGVKTDYVLFTEVAKTALAFVSLDKLGERSFSFYRPPSADLCFTSNDFQPNWFEKTAIFHFCSNSLTEANILEATKTGIALAKKNNALISFDVNLRTNLWGQQCDPLSVIWSVIENIDVLKVSKEELSFLCGNHTEQDTIARLLQCECKLILISDGGNSLRWITALSQGEITPPSIDMLDATAAGDAFVGGLLFKLQWYIGSVASFDDLINKQSDLCKILTFAAACGAHAASKYGAFPSLPTLSSLTALTREIDYDIA